MERKNSTNPAGETLRKNTEEVLDYYMELISYYTILQSVLKTYSLGPIIFIKFPLISFQIPAKLLISSS